LNDDGQPDLAVANLASFNVAILLGDGAGGFSAPTTFATGAIPRAIAIGDLDGDGRQDLAVANLGSDDVSVLLGDGLGGFGAAATFTAGTDPHDIAIGALNGDGLPDIVVANLFSANVSVFVNQCSAWSDLGSGLAGVDGVPALVGTGTLAAGSTGSLSLTSAKPSSPALLFVALASAPTPFKGGVLVANPFVLALMLATGGGGSLLLPFTWPSGVPAATSLYFQFAVQDAAGPQGASLSNALEAVTP
ncbi:MAG TPA: VCBS repeat-containing protein, partial [Planctomycetota bacterium]|nr:VCBS repeat-containing protein [Planctomycetota bacterium]